jgi:chromosome partitioning protein
MHKVYGIAIRKGGQGKSTTVATLARLCALYGARVLVVDLAQPGTATASLRNLWPETEHGDVSGALMAFHLLPAGTPPGRDDARVHLRASGLPVMLASQPSWSGGYIAVLPWDELLADGAAHLRSERVLAGLLDALATEIDIVLLDCPAEAGPLLTNALACTQRLIVPLVAEAPALEGLEVTLRLLRQVRASGFPITLGGIVVTRCDAKNRRALEIVQTILHSGTVEGEPLGQRLLPFAIRQNEFFEQSFRFGEAIWERTANPTHWAGYVLLAEWLLRDAGLAHLAENRRGPALLPPDTRVLDVSALMLTEPEVQLADFAKAHAAPRA